MIRTITFVCLASGGKKKPVKLPKKEVKELDEVSDKL